MIQLTTINASNWVKAIHSGGMDPTSLLESSIIRSVDVQKVKLAGHSPYQMREASKSLTEAWCAAQGRWQFVLQKILLQSDLGWARKN